MGRAKRKFSARSLGRGVVIGSVVVAGGLLGAGVMRDRMFRQIRESAAEAGIPLTQQQLFPPHKGDPSTNAFGMISPLKKINTYHLGQLIYNYKDDHLDEIRAELTKRESDLQVLTAMAQRTDYTPTYKGEGLGLSDVDDFETFKSSIQLLSLRIRLRAADHDYAGALQDIDTSVKLNNLLQTHPVVISQLVRTALSTITLKTVAECGPELARDPKSADTLRNEVDKIKPVNFATTLTGESFHSCRLAVIQSAPHLPSIDFDPPTFFPSLQSSVSGIWLEITQPIWGQAMVQAWSKDLAEVRKKPYDSECAALALPHAQALRKQPGVIGSVTEMIAPTFLEFVRSTRGVETRKALVKLELTALGSKTMPNTAGTLDPFSHQPYKVVKSGSGWTLYSVGLNGVDDGGQITKQPVTDLVIHFENGKARMFGK